MHAAPNLFGIALVEPFLFFSVLNFEPLIVALFKMRRSGSGEMSSAEYTYCWSGMIIGASLKGIAMGISSQLQ